MVVNDALYRRALKFYLILVAAITVCIGVYNVHRRDDWAVADWLINYSAGFVRRGFLGQLVTTLARVHVPPLAFLFLLQLSLYAVMLSAVLHLAKRVEWSVWTCALIYSPATLAFSLNDPSFAYRKEILLLALLGAILIMLSRQSVSDRTLSAMIAASAAVCVLSHEALLAYLPYLFCALLLGYGRLDRALKVAAVPAAVSLVCFAAVSRFPGSDAVSQKICASVKSELRSAPSDFCGGAIDYLHRSPAYARSEASLQLHNAAYLHHFLIVAALALLPVVILLGRLWSRNRFAVVCISACATASAAATVPLFLYGTDWTRWIYIHVFCLFLLLLYTLRQQQSRDPDWPHNRLLRLLSYGVLALYIFGWNLSPYTPRVPFGGLVHYVLHHRWNAPLQATASDHPNA